MTSLHALLLGILEGLTEFLPVSSTGHLFLFGKYLGHEDEAAKTLEIVIQLGAVIAVVVYYRARLLALVRGLLRREEESVRLTIALAIGFLPAAIIGYAFHKVIKKHLMSTWPIAGALIVGGVVMMAIEIIRKRRGIEGADGLAQVTPKRALVIGLSQCFALWPGASRSMSTIVGGQLAGLSTATAAEFSFLLAIPTLGAATVFDLLKNWRLLVGAPGGAVTLTIGMVVSFVVALLVIAAFLRYLKRFGLAPFGAYRIALGALVLLAATRGAEPPAAASDEPRGAGAIADDPGRNAHR